MLTLVVWDVQHGHAIYMETPSSKIAFDLGTGSYGSNQEFSPLLHLKNKWNVTSLDGVVITHPHRDHLDDIFNFDALSPRILWRPRHLSEIDIRKGNRDKDNAILDAYLAINARYNHPVAENVDPFLPKNNGGVQIEMFAPRSCAMSNLNNHSLVTVITYEASKILLPGDNEPASWEELLRDSAFVRAIAGTNVLIAPHHGRDSGFSTELFKHISPDLVIVSDGRFCDTSATDRYSKKATGWQVHKRNGDAEDRKCLTTRNDGVIVVKLGRNPDQCAFLEVNID